MSEINTDTSTNTTLDLAQYYPNLLIRQYIGKPKAYATVQSWITPILMPQISTQDISFSLIPNSGVFVINYSGNNSSDINWDDSLSTIQTKIQSIPGLSGAIVSGSIADQLLTITFNGVSPPALLLSITSNSLEDSDSNPVSISVVETDLTIPLAVQAAFNMMGNNIAQGVQLDVLGKYAGVTRYGTGFDGQPITLDDSDFYSLIRMAIATNSNGSSMNDIENLMNIFFPGEITVIDYQNMQMSYIINASVGSQNLIQLFVTEGLLPAPMTVEVSVIYIVDINLFAFVTYQQPTQPSNTRPFNTYQTYNLTWPWVTYQDGIIS